MPYVPPEQRDSSYYIFNEKYRCSVPYIDTRSADHIRMFGTPSCGIKELDRETVRERLDTYLSINQMAEYFKRGAIVGVKRIEDTKKIYERITDHLNAWKEQLRHGLNNGDAPIDDLMLLDKLANAIYAHAKYQFTEDIIDSILLRQIGGIMPVTRESLIGNMSKAKQRQSGEPTENSPNEPEQKPERPTMSDFFATYQRGSTLKTNRWE